METVAVLLVAAVAAWGGVTVARLRVARRRVREFRAQLERRVRVLEAGSGDPGTEAFRAAVLARRHEDEVRRWRRRTRRIPVRLLAPLVPLSVEPSPRIEVPPEPSRLPIEEA